jgi:hypothetical protein
VASAALGAHGVRGAVAMAAPTKKSWPCPRGVESCGRGRSLGAMAVGEAVAVAVAPSLPGFVLILASSTTPRRPPCPFRGLERVLSVWWRGRDKNGVGDKVEDVWVRVGPAPNCTLKGQNVTWVALCHVSIRSDRMCDL